MSLFLAAILCFAPAEPPPVLEMDELRMPPTPVDQKVQALAKQPGALADYLDTVSPADQRAHRIKWMMALRASQRWERLLSLTESILKEPTDAPRNRIHIHLERLRALNALDRTQAFVDASLEVAALGFPEHTTQALTKARGTTDWAYLEATANRVLAREPRHGEALAWKGEALVKQGRFPEAEPVLLEASTQAPGHPLLWANLAACRQTRGASAEALEAADKALALDATCLEAHYNRASALMALKRYPEARTALTQALARAQDPALKATLQDLLARTDRYLAWQEKKAAAKPAPKRAGR